MLQAEENRSSRSTRATRGSAKGTAKPVKKAEKKTRKKKVVEPEYDSDGNEIVKKKNGAFNKEWALSEPLSILVGGATQVRTPICLFRSHFWPSPAFGKRIKLTHG